MQKEGRKSSQLSDLCTKGTEFFRKGVIGNYKSYMSAAQIERLMERYEGVFKGTSIIEIWRPYVQVSQEDDDAGQS